MNNFRGSDGTGLVGGLALVEAFVGGRDVIDLKDFVVIEDLNSEIKVVLDFNLSPKEGQILNYYF